jgi:triacylglycerol lipase
MEPTTDVERTAVKIGADTAYALCSFVDGASTTLPDFWQQAWVPDHDFEGHTATVFQMFMPIVYPFGGYGEIPLPVFALAIQGTKNIWDALSDFKVTPQVPFSPISGAAIAKGSQDGLDDILALKRTSQGSVERLKDFLMNFAHGSTLMVTGHSLGGNVGSVIAPWIAAHVPAFGGGGGTITALPSNLPTITFAAPTAGNEAFASFLNSQPSYQAYFNSNDVVPHVWAASGPWSAYDIDSLFPAPGPNPAPPSVHDVIQKKMKELADAQISYTQTTGKIFAFPTVTASGKDPWMWELGYQHNYAYCMQFLGAQGNCKPPDSGS